jgi:hypothetical protein
MESRGGENRLKFRWSEAKPDRHSRSAAMELGEVGLVMMSYREPEGVKDGVGGGSAGGRAGWKEAVHTIIGGSEVGLVVGMVEGMGSSTGGLVAGVGTAARIDFTVGIWPNPTHRVRPDPSHSRSGSVGSHSGQQSQSRAQSRSSGVML